MLSRRSFFAGLGATIAAPAIVRAASLMPVRALVVPKVTAQIFYEGGWAGPAGSVLTLDMMMAAKAAMEAAVIQPFWLTGPSGESYYLVGKSSL